MEHWFALFSNDISDIVLKRFEKNETNNNNRSKLNLLFALFKQIGIFLKDDLNTEENKVVKSLCMQRHFNDKRLVNMCDISTVCTQIKYRELMKKFDSELPDNYDELIRYFLKEEKET